MTMKEFGMVQSVYGAVYVLYAHFFICGGLDWSFDGIDDSADRLLRAGNGMVVVSAATDSSAAGVSIHVHNSEPAALDPSIWERGDEITVHFDGPVYLLTQLFERGLGLSDPLVKFELTARTWHIRCHVRGRREASSLGVAGDLPTWDEAAARDPATFPEQFLIEFWPASDK
ncbi:hypothetical protein ACFWPX_29850 [Nocardia sp. NPDC058518]|uniref:hypothetical protein n=1 Tax=Nocardia sp. NPDC058518 TaxID=3346534 RepID=UPI00364A698A